MTLETYIDDYLGEVADHFGWSTGANSYDFLVEDILEEYGVATEADATNLDKLHAIAKYKSWEKVMNAASTNYKFSVDGGSYDRNQIFDMAEKNYNRAILLALPYIANYNIETGEVDDSEQDPYSNVPYWDRYN